MQEDDRETRLDDDTANRTGDGPERPQQAPVVRLLANPRRVRRL